MRRIPLLFFIIFIAGCRYLGKTAATPLPTPDLSATLETSLPSLALTELPVTVTPPNELAATLTFTPRPGISATPQPPTRTLVPSRTRRPRTPTPTFTPSLTPTLDPSNVILRIAAPGPMSKLTSPIDFVVYISPDYVGLTRIELLGEDGRELYRKVFRTYSNIGYTTRVDEKINFEIHGAAEVARLQISTLDEYNRLQAFNSVRLLLLSVGENELSPAYPLLEHVVLRSPKKGDEISGGELTVRGEIRPVNDSPIVLELFDIDGNLIGSRVLDLNPADGSYQIFNTTLPYKVDKKMPARLTFRQSDDRIAGMAFLYSMRLWVNP
jgi:hypothetical protein